MGARCFFTAHCKTTIKNQRVYSLHGEHADSVQRVQVCLVKLVLVALHPQRLQPISDCGHCRQVGGGWAEQRLRAAPEGRSQQRQKKGECENPEIETLIAQRPQHCCHHCFLLPHRVGSALREAGCLMSRSRDDSRDSKVGRSPRSACQHCSIREWRAEGQLCGAGRRYWSATAFITCSHGGPRGCYTHTRALTLSLALSLCLFLSPHK